MAFDGFCKWMYNWLDPLIFSVRSTRKLTEPMCAPLDGQHSGFFWWYDFLVIEPLDSQHLYLPGFQSFLSATLSSFMDSRPEQVMVSILPLTSMQASHLLPPLNFDRTFWWPVWDLNLLASKLRLISFENSWSANYYEWGKCPRLDQHGLPLWLLYAFPQGFKTTPQLQISAPWISYLFPNSNTSSTP